MSRASAAAIDALRKRNPDGLRLAQAVSFAVIVDRSLLRAARLELVHGADAGAEADLWFSNLVKSRTADGIVLDSEVAEELRRAMSPEQVEAAWRLTSREHEPWLAPSLFFEEEIAYFSVSAEPGARDRMAKRVQSVVRAMLRNDRPGLAQWASRALTMFPSAVRELPETKMLDAGTRIRLGQGVSAGETLPEWMPLVVPPMERTSLQLELRERELRLLVTQGPSREAATVIAVPDTNPVVVELSWNEGSAATARQVLLRRGEKVRVPIGNDSVRIRTITGDEFEVSEPAQLSAALGAEIIDFTEEIARYPTPINRPEIDEILTRGRDVVLSGERGIGKTTMLCEIIRRLAPAPVFVHFFDPGDYQRGRLSAAMRSIAAQIALRYHLEESVVELPLGDVLARLELSPRRPERLFIALDDIDLALGEDRQPAGDALQVMFPTRPDFVTVFGTRIDSHGRLPVGPNVVGVVKMFGAEIGKRSNGNFGVARALAADQSRFPPGVPALAMARGWLPASLFEDALDSPAVMRRGDEVRVIPGLDLSRLKIDVARNDLLDLLRRNLTLEPVRRYYALHLPAHVGDAGNLDVRDFQPAFMKEVIRLHDTALLKAHFARADHPAQLITAIEREEEAITADPEEIEPVLRTYVPDLLELAGTALEVIDRPEQNERLPRRLHDGAVAGIFAGTLTWGDDARVLNWTFRDTPGVIENASPITAAAVTQGVVLWADAAGFVHAGWEATVNTVAAHAGPVAGIAIAAGAPVIASWGADGLIRLWSLRRSDNVIDPIGDLGFHEDDITSCAFVGGDRLLVSASRDGTIRTWSVAERRAIQVIRKPSPVTGCVISSNGRWLAAVEEAGSLTIAAVEPASERTITPQVIRTDHRGGIHGVALSPNDRFIATWGGEGDGTMIWTILPATPWRPPARFGFVETPRGQRVTTCMFLDGLLVAWSGGGAVISSLGTQSSNTPLDTDGAVICCAADAPQTFFTGDDRGRMIEWEKPLGRRLRDYSRAPHRINAIAATSEHELTIKDNGDVRIDDKVFATISGARLAVHDEHAAVWSPRDNQIARVNLRKGTFIPMNAYSTSPITALAVGRESNVIAVAHANGEVVKVGETPASVLRTLTDSITALAFMSDDSELLVGTAAGGVMKIDIESREVRTIASNAGHVVAIEADEKRRQYAVLSDDGRLHVYPLDPVSIGPYIEIGPALGCRFGPNREVIFAVRNKIAVWHSESSERFIVKEHRAPITGFDVDFDVVYTCSEDRTIRIWSLPDLEQLGVAYGYNAFRCLSVMHGEITAGDDAGEIWHFRARPDDTLWQLVFGEEDGEFASKLRASLTRNGIRTTKDESESVIHIVNTTLRLPGRGIVVVVGEDASILPPGSVDFRRWRDPYVYEERLQQLLEPLTFVPPVRK